MLGRLLLHGPAWAYVAVVLGFGYYWTAVPASVLLLVKATRTSLRVALGLSGALVAFFGLFVVAVHDNSPTGHSFLLYGVAPLAEFGVALFMLWRLGASR